MKLTKQDYARVRPPVSGLPVIKAKEMPRRGRPKAEQEIISEELAADNIMDLLEDSGKLWDMSARTISRLIRSGVGWPVRESQLMVETLNMVGKAMGVTQPTGTSWESVIRRYMTKKWWRRALIIRNRRLREVGEISGFNVWSGAGRYCSDRLNSENFNYRVGQMNMLDSSMIMSPSGKQVSMMDIWEKSNANPANRRARLLAQISGEESLAKDRGDEALFITITAPSKYHAVLRDGTKNRKFGNFTPRDTQAYLIERFGVVRKQVNKDLKGLLKPPVILRTVEPHHDATPHWHMVVFVNPKYKARYVHLINASFKKVSPNERGIEKRRVVVKEFGLAGPGVRSVVAYAVKYICKNIDGYGVPPDEDGTKAEESAERIRAWSWIWGIKQFRWLGVASSTLWDQLRRHSLPLCEDDTGNPELMHLERVRNIAREGDWAEFSRNVRGVKLLMEKNPGKNDYGEDLPDMAVGFVCGKTNIRTTEGKWVIQWRQDADYEGEWMDDDHGFDDQDDDLGFDPEYSGMAEFNILDMETGQYLTGS